MSDEATQAALRQMAEKIGGLTSSVQSLEHNWRNQEEKASNGRAVLHAKIDDLRNDFLDVRGKLAGVIADVAEMRPTVDEIKTAKERAVGAIMMSRVLYAIGIVLTMGVTWVLTNWIEITFRNGKGFH